MESVKSYADAGVIVISSVEDIKKIPEGLKYIVVAQTTFDECLFQEITDTFKKENIMIY